MKNKQTIFWFFDALIIILFLLEYWLDFTGYQLHEVLGLIVFVFLLLHLFMHGQWVGCVCKRLFQSMGKRTGLYFLLDIVLLVLFFTITLTGLLISSLLNLNLMNYEIWRFYHVSASYLALAMVGLKIALHWKWIVSIARRKIICRSLSPVCTGVEPERIQSMSRRQFLEGTGIFTGAILFAGIEYSDWITRHMFQAVEDLSIPQLEPTASMTPFQPETATFMPVEQTNDLAETATAQPTEEMPLPPTVTQGIAPTQASVRCTRACSYPGRCRRYVDSNQNNRCDLSEW